MKEKEIKEEKESSFLVYFGLLFFILGLNLFATALIPNTTWVTIWGALLTVIGIVIMREGFKK